MSIHREIVRGTIWAASARWLVRGLGIVSLAILARIITPQDYGLIALATLVTGMIGVFSEVGIIFFLFREPNLHRSHFDTAWTLRIIISLVLGSLILLVSPFAGRAFSEPNVTPVIQWLSIPMFLQGFQNPGTAWFRKQLDFRKDFIFISAPKFVSFAVTILLAFVWRDYRALVAGIVAGSVATFVQSYLMHPFRPRFDLSRTREMWGFSAWTMIYHVMEFLAAKAPTMIIGRMRNATAVGLYNVADDLATAPIYELGVPLTRVLVPAYSKIAQDSAQLTQVFTKVFSATAIAVFAIGMGTFLVAQDAVIVVLGERWIEAAPLVQLLAPVGGLMALSQPVQPLLIALGRPQASALLMLVQLIIGVPLMAMALTWEDLPELAAARIVTAVVVFLVMLGAIIRFAGISHVIVIANTWRPALAALVMFVAVRLVQDIAPDIAFIRLAMAIAVGAIVYAAVLFGGWRAVGMPNSIESDIIEACRKGIAKRGGK